MLIFWYVYMISTVVTNDCAHVIIQFWYLRGAWNALYKISVGNWLHFGSLHFKNIVERIIHFTILFLLLYFFSPLKEEGYSTR